MLNYFDAWIDVMYTRLSSLISWPERSELMKTMPLEFRKHFRKCEVIIDCFEIFIERPTSLTACAQTWANYKHYNTVKFLIGITPQVGSPLPPRRAGCHCHTLKTSKEAPSGVAP